MQPTARAVVRPADFDLAAAWRSIVTDVDARRAPVTVRLRTDPRTLDVLQYMFGNRVEASAEVPDGRLDVAVRVQSDLMAARQLAGFADAIEVLSPDRVRAHLADIGRGLLRRHG